MPIVPLTPVESSQLEAIGYDSETQTLAVRFKSKGSYPGSLYHYNNVSSEDWSAFQAADSKGSHFIRNIKRAPDRFPYQRIDEREDARERGQ